MVVPDKKTKAQIQDDRLNGHWDKIEALEKNIKSMVETDTSNQDRIISLEKKLEDLEDMQKTEKKEFKCPICQERISLETEFDCLTCESEITLKEMMGLGGDSEK